MDASRFHRILIVEDEDAVATREATLLSENGYATRTVSTGETGIEALADDSTIDMVLVDIELGAGIDGVETARRALLVRPLPVLFVTGHSEPDIVTRAAGVPHYGYIEKRTSPLVFLQAVEMAYRLFNAHRETRRETENLRATLDSVSDAVLVTDRAGRIVSCNAGVTAVFGYAIDEIVGQWFVSLCSIDRRKVHWDRFETALADGAADLTDECLHKDGTLVPVHASFRVRADADGHPMGCVEVLRTTDNSAATRRLQEEIDGLESEIDRLGKEFTSRGEAADIDLLLGTVKTGLDRLREVSQPR